MKHAAFLVNTVSAVCLVFVNRRLLGNCAFRYVGFLAGLHMLVTAAVAVHTGGSNKTATLEKVESMLFMFATVLSLLCMNASLMLNHVGVYQITKILMIPACAALEYALYGKTMTTHQAGAVVFVIAGVMIATASDLGADFPGLVMASLGILFSSAHNVFCSALTRKYEVDGATLVRLTAPLQAVALVILGPVVDKIFADSFPWEWERNSHARGCVTVIATSCALAALVNLSIAECIRTYSATGTLLLCLCVGVLLFRF